MCCAWTRRLALREEYPKCVAAADDVR
jgi:hypothetical protein